MDYGDVTGQGLRPQSISHTVVHSAEPGSYLPGPVGFYQISCTL
jgi:hypothetical protein